ncbi:MAG: short-chain dehydrogenase [Planctomycetota bacterium]|nr:MAG: short-chain dehydrogenase [Planctomycetota bacterium]HIC22740.1 SDR family oxidoreductase [Planctomycetota bacterium]
MSAKGRLEGKNAIITGAGSGIGLAIARRFAAEGAHLGLLEVNEESAETARAELSSSGAIVEAIVCDVSQRDSVSGAFARIDETLGTPQILVNNAGIAHVGDLLDTEEEDLDRLYAVNVKGVALCSREAVRRMLENSGGVILNLASIASHIGLEDRFAYSMTKGAVWTMTRSIATDYMKKGIRCNCVAPCRVHTPFVDGFIAENYPGQEKEKFEELSAYQPMGRMARPEEVADLALFLCSDESAFITGHSFPIDGGVMVI